MTKNSNVLIMRHAERMDHVESEWIRNSFQNSEYKPSNLNFPLTVPKRKGMPSTFLDDGPITNFGQYQAQLVGESLLRNKIRISAVITSPALRSIQTAHYVLKGMNLDKKIPINIDPGAFEALYYYDYHIPYYMTPNELRKAGFNINKKYTPSMSLNELKNKKWEGEVGYHERTAHVTLHAIKYNQNIKGDGAVLIVGHTSTPDACIRKFVNPNVSTKSNLYGEVPYCGMIKATKRENGWTVDRSPIPPFTSAGTPQFDYKCFIED